MQWQGHMECRSPSLPNHTTRTNAMVENERNNKEERKFHIEFFGGNYELDLYTWDNLVDVEIIKKISESYIPDRD